MESVQPWTLLVLGLLLLAGFAAHEAGTRAHVPRGGLVESEALCR